MNFKVGQRVRIIACEPYSIGARHSAIGKEAVIVAIPSKHSAEVPPAQCDIRMDGMTDDWTAAFYQLAPLTDGKADEFIERIKKLKPYDEPVVPAVVFERMAEYERIRK